MSGPQLGAFQAHHPLAEGGMGVVWLATHTASGTSAAIKVLTREGARTPRAHRLFLAEVAAVAGLDHPGIVRVLDYGQVSEAAAAASVGRLAAGSPWLAMELASGTLVDEAPSSWHALRDVLLTVLDALAHAHARGVVHRDLKPANLLRFSGGRLKLSDFGLAHTAQLDPEAPVAGTPAYMPPEQIEGRWRAFGPGTDLYALACTAWELLTGEPPFGSVMGRALLVDHRLNAPPRLRARFPVPVGLEAWLGQLLLKSPWARPAFAASAAASLHRLGPPEGVGHRPTSRQQPTRTFTLRLSTWEHFDDEPPAPEPTAEEVSAVPTVSAPFPMRWESPTPTFAPVSVQGAGLGLWGLRRAAFVGRTQERDRLWTSLAHVAGGACRAVILAGEPGVGKTRLARWVGERCRELGLGTWLETADQTGVLDPLGETLIRHLRAAGLSGGPLVSWLGERLAPAHDTDRLHALAGWLDGSRTPPRGERLRLAHWVLDCESRRGPCVWVVDEARSGSDPLALTRRILTRAPDARILVLLTAAAAGDLAQHRAELRDQDGVDWLELEPLPRADRSHQVRGLLALETRLVSEVARFAEGNPRRAEDRVGAWVASNALQAHPDGFRLRPDWTQPAHRSGWNERLSAALTGRPTLDLAATRLAALHGGTEVPLRSWLEACNLARCTPSDGLVAALCRAGLARWTEQGFAFAHPGAPAEILEDSGEAELRPLASALASARLLEPEPDPEALSRLLMRAGRWLEAAELLPTARTVRSRLGDYGAALALDDLWTQCLDKLGAADEDVRRMKIGVAHAETLRLVGRSEEGVARIDPLVATLRKLGDRTTLAEALRVRGACLQYIDPARADADLTEAPTLLEDPYRRALVEQVLAERLRQRGDLLASLALNRAVYPVAVEHGDHSLAGYVSTSMACARQVLGDRSGAETIAELLDRAHHHFTRYGSRHGLGLTANIRSDLARETGDLDEAIAQLHIAQRHFEAIEAGDAVFSQLNLALVHLQRRDPVAAERALAPLRERVNRGELGSLAGVILLVTATVDASLGRWEAWEAGWTRGAEEVRARSQLEGDFYTLIDTVAERAAADQVPAALEAAQALRAWLDQHLHR